MRPRLKLGVVGLGRGFMLTLPALRNHPGIALVAAVDPRREALDRFAQEFGGRGFETIDAMIAAACVDAVYIATPHELHAAQAIAALDSGLHVLVEKPMAATPAEAAAMVRAADRCGAILMVGPSHGFDPPVRLAAEMIAGGEFGSARMVTTFNFTDFMYRPRRVEELDSARGGGVIFSQAAHQIDMVRRLVGQKVVSVRAVAGEWDDARPSHGAYQALLTFAGGAVASLTYSGYAHFDSDELMDWVSELGHRKDPDAYGAARRALAANADEAQAKLSRTYGGNTPAPAAARHHEHFGFALVSCDRADLRLRPDGVEVHGDDRRWTVPLNPPAPPRAAVFDDFTAAIAGRRAPIHDGEWGLHTMLCCAALLESSRTKREIDIL